MSKEKILLAYSGGWIRPSSPMAQENYDCEVIA
jgi:hypothetical protein